MPLRKLLDLVTLPFRTAVLLFLLGAAYFLGSGQPQLISRQESPETGVVAEYARNGRPWRIFYDRNLDRKWDMWIDQRGGSPFIVSIDDDGDGQPDRDEDEFGRPLSATSAARLKAEKTFHEFITNPRQLEYSAVAMMLYALLEFSIRSYTAKN